MIVGNEGSILQKPRRIRNSEAEGLRNGAARHAVGCPPFHPIVPTAADWHLGGRSREYRMTSPRLTDPPPP